MARRSPFETRIPPPIVAAAGGLIVYVTDLVVPGVPLARPVRIAAAALLAGLGVLVALAGLLEFRRAATTWDPHRPDRTSALVTRGIYGRTRNPMYVGLLLVLLGWSAWLAQPIGAVLGAAFFIAWLTRFQIGPEERVLQERFGEDFSRYCSRTRRWL